MVLLHSGEPLADEQISVRNEQEPQEDIGGRSGQTNENSGGEYR